MTRLIRVVVMSLAFAALITLDAAAGLDLTWDACSTAPGIIPISHSIAPTPALFIGCSARFSFARPCRELSEWTAKLISSRTLTPCRRFGTWSKEDATMLASG
jgi:hypothetical protein